PFIFQVFGSFTSQIFPPPRKEELTYVVLPLLMRLHWGNRSMFFMNFGGYSEYFIPVPKELRKVSLTQLSNERKVSAVSPFNIGMIAGIGTAFVIRDSYVVSLELRDQFGFTSLTRIGFFGTKPNSLSLLLGLGYRL